MRKFFRICAGKWSQLFEKNKHFHFRIHYTVAWQTLTPQNRNWKFVGKYSHIYYINCQTIARKIRNETSACHSDSYSNIWCVNHVFLGYAILHPNVLDNRTLDNAKPNKYSPTMSDTRWPKKRCTHKISTLKNSIIWNFDIKVKTASFQSNESRQLSYSEPKMVIFIRFRSANSDDLQSK